MAKSRLVKGLTLSAFARRFSKRASARQAPVEYNCRMHECPLCGEAMRLSEREVKEMDGTVRQVREWICPECDYFEEADTEG